MTNQMTDTVEACANNRAFVTGDIHANIYDLETRLEEANVSEGDTIIIAGDVGLVYGKPYLGRSGTWQQPTDRIDNLEYVCEDFGVHCAVIRGNHDTRYIRDMREGMLGDFSHVCNENGSWYLLYRAPHVLFASDRGGAYHIAGKDVLVIPGAWSIDGAWRRYNDVAWEREEQLDPAERARLLGMAKHIPFDAVISHTCPKAWMAKMGDLLLQGYPNIDNTMEAWLDEVLEAVNETSDTNNPKWYFGHFHDDRKIRGTSGRLLYHDMVRL